MSIIPADQVRTLTPPPSWQETRRENRRQIRQARRKARADAAEKRTRERETAVTSLRDRTERAIRWSAQHGSHCVTINPRDDECRIAETIFEELTDNGYQLTIVLDQHGAGAEVLRRHLVPRRRQPPDGRRTRHPQHL